MGAPLLDGFERGFNMMERHDARVGRKERLSRMDEQNESRYQAGQTRLADMDKQNESRYQDTQTQQATNNENTANYRTSMLNSSQERTENQKEQNLWQRNKSDEQQQWGLVAPQLQNIHEEYLKTGTMPDQAAKFFKDNPQYADYSPESFRNPEYVKSIKTLKAKTNEIFKGGKLHQFKSPEYIEMFNGAFKSKIQQGVGDVDLARNATVTGKRVAQLIPTREGKVSIGLEVSYKKENGETYTEIQPMTHGRTREDGDPVTEWGLKELMTAIEVRSSMADLALNGEEYQAKSQKTLGAMKGPDKNPDWKEVKGDLGQTLGYQNLNNGQFQKLAGGAEEAGMNIEEKANNKQQVALEQTNTFLSAAGGMSKDLGLDLNDDDIATVVQMFETQARQSGGKADLNELMTNMLKNHAKTKAATTKQKAEQQAARKAHIAENPDISPLSFK
jgi:hypothetical protein